jgi:hypothetical protein
VASARENVVSDHDDVEMRAIRCKLVGEQVAGSRQALRDILKNRKAPATSLDLIGHSTGKECYLMLGGWTIDDTPFTGQFFQDVRQDLQRLGVSAVRLLGCSTAITQAGWAVMERIAGVLGDHVPVWGTLRTISAVDFGPAGYDGGNLASTAGGPPDRAGPIAPPFPGDARREVPFAIDHLVAEDRATLPEARWPRVPVARERAPELVALVEAPFAWSLPGLLAEPLVELLVATDPPARVRRLHVLLGYEVLRVFAPGHESHGLLYRITEPARLERLLAGWSG